MDEMDQARVEAPRTAAGTRNQGDTYEDVVAGADAFYVFLTKGDGG